MTASLIGPVTLPRVVMWCLIAWSSFFLIIVAPITLIYHARVSTHEIVTAQLSNYRIEKRKDRYGNLHDVTFATMTFDQANGITCKLDNQSVRHVGDISSRPSSIEIAIHPQSCYEYLRLPLSNVWLQMLGIFSAGLLFVGVITASFAMQGLEENKT